jgi:hypothetical protein
VADAGLGVVVEVVEGLAVGDAAELEVGGDAPLEAVGALAAEQVIEEPYGRALFAGDAFEAAGEWPLSRGQLGACDLEG